MKNNQSIYTKTHKVRLFFGIHGQQHDLTYCFDVPNWGGVKTRRVMHKFMFYIGDPLLNLLIGKGPAFKAEKEI